MSIKEFKKYTKPSSVWPLVSAVFLVVLTTSFVGVILDDSVRFTLRGIIVFPLGIVVFAYMLYTSTKEQKLYRQYLQQLQETGELERILADFGAAQSMANDGIRLGQMYAYRKKEGKPVPYQEICRVYQHIDRRNSKETGRSLKYFDPAGKEHTLCALRTQEKSVEDVKKIAAFLQSKNPNVKFGYEK